MSSLNMKTLPEAGDMVRAYPDVWVLPTAESLAAVPFEQEAIFKERDKRLQGREKRFADLMNNRTQQGTSI